MCLSSWFAQRSIWCWDTGLRLSSRGRDPSSKAQCSTGHCCSNGNWFLHSLLLHNRYLLRNNRLGWSSRCSMFPTCPDIRSGVFHPWWNHWSFSSDIMSHFLHHYRMLYNSWPLSLDVIPRRSGPILRNVEWHFSSLKEPLQRNPRLWRILNHPRSYLCQIYYSI